MSKQFRQDLPEDYAYLLALLGTEPTHCQKKDHSSQSLALRGPELELRQVLERFLCNMGRLEDLRTFTFKASMRNASMRPE